MMKDTNLKNIIVVTDHENRSISYRLTYFINVSCWPKNIFVKDLINVMLFCPKTKYIAFVFPKGKIN